MKKLERLAVCAALLASLSAPVFAADSKKKGTDWKSAVMKNGAYVWVTEAAGGIGKAVEEYFYFGYDQKKIAESLAKTLEARRKSTLGNNVGYATLGVMFLLLGLLGALVYGFQLLLRCFDAGLVWGLAYLAMIFMNVAPVARKLGEWNEPLAMVVYPLFWIYVVVYWEVSRKPVICQMFSLSSILMGIFWLGRA